MWVLLLISLSSSMNLSAHKEGEYPSKGDCESALSEYETAPGYALTCIYWNKPV